MGNKNKQKANKHTHTKQQTLPKKKKSVTCNKDLGWVTESTPSNSICSFVFIPLSQQEYLLLLPCPGKTG